MGAIADTRAKGDTLEERLDIILTLSFFCGVWMLLFGVLGLESLIHFVSKPVFTGFVSACGVITALSVTKDMLGVYVQKSPRIFEILPDILRAVPETSIMTMLIALISLLLMFILKFAQGKTKKLALKKPKRSCIDKTCELIPPILLLIVVGISMGGSLCSWTKSSSSSAPISVEPAIGEGASLPAYFYRDTSDIFVRSTNEQIIEDFTTNMQKINVSYTPTGSGSGQESLIQNQVDFAGTDVVFSDEDITRAPDIVIFPTVATAVCAVANIISENTRLDIIVSRDALVKIFTGVITHWDDPDILKDNANIHRLLPHEPIKTCMFGGVVLVKRNGFLSLILFSFSFLFIRFSSLLVSMHKLNLYVCRYTI